MSRQDGTTAAALVVTQTGHRDRPPWPLLAQVQSVLVEYGAYLPLTVRQVFYRLVGAHAYEKTERAYDRLVDHLVRARRAKLIPFGSLRDDGVTVQTPRRCGRRLGEP